MRYDINNPDRYENSVKANFVEIVFHALRWISFRECGAACYRVIEDIIL